MEFRVPLATAPFAPTLQTLDLVRRVNPPGGVIHVGAGNGVAACRLWGDAAVEHLLLVDANPAEAAQLAAAASKVVGWNAACVLLGEQDAEDAAYYLTSSPTANGRVCADELRSIWPNLRGLETQRMPECRLEGLLDGRDPSVFPAPNWIYVDCFPALPVLKGAGHYLDGLDVVWARVVLDPQALAIEGGSLVQVAAFLAAQGFRTVEVVEGVHPAFGDALFVRDWRGRLEPQVHDLEHRNADLTLRCDQLIELAAHRQAQVEQLTQAHEVQTGLAAERQAQIEQLAQERDAQARLAAERQAQIEQLAQERDAQAWHAAERQGQIEQLAQERDAQALLAAERQAQVEQLAQERDAQARLAAERQAQIEQLAQAHEAQARLAAERQGQVEQLTRAHDARARFAAERQIQVAVLTQARDAQARLAVERQARIEQLAREGEVQTELAAERQTRIAQLTDARDAQAELAAELQAKLEQLTEARDVQARLAAERQTQIALLTQARDAQTRLAAERQAQIVKAAQTPDAEGIAGARDRQTYDQAQGHDDEPPVVTDMARDLDQSVPFHDQPIRIAQTRGREPADLPVALRKAQRRCSELEGHLAEIETRHRRMDREMVRAEAQIDLIKDILLRGPGV